MDLMTKLFNAKIELIKRKEQLANAKTPAEKQAILDEINKLINA